MRKAALSLLAVTVTIPALPLIYVFMVFRFALEASAGLLTVLDRFVEEES